MEVKQKMPVGRAVTAAEIVAARPITEVWIGLGGDAPKRGRARAFYRNGDNTQTVSVNDTKSCWYDHRDNIGGGVLDLVQRVLGCNRGGALRWLSAFTGLPLRESPLTTTERRRYAQARGEAAELIAWKERLVEALKHERRRWWRVNHGARMHVSEHGLESELGAAMATLYEISEREIDELQIHIDTLMSAGYPELLLVFREQKGSRAA